MNQPGSDLDAVFASLDSDQEHALLFHRVMRDFPEALATEVVIAALRRGLISNADAVDLVRSSNLAALGTLEELARRARDQGLAFDRLVIEALEGQPH